MVAIKVAAKRVLLVDDHPIVREGLGRVIDAEDGLVVCAQVGTEAEAAAAMAREGPDVLVLDLSLGDGGSGIELLKRARAEWPAVPVLVLSMHDEGLHAERVLRLGARGYVMKQEATETLVAAIRKVLRGEIYLSERMASRMLAQLAAPGGARAPERAAGLGRLTAREMQVFEAIGRGEPPRDIARRLGLSVKTVEAHRERIKEKLGMRSGNELVRYAVSYQMNGLDVGNPPSST